LDNPNGTIPDFINEFSFDGEEVKHHGDTVTTEYFVIKESTAESHDLLKVIDVDIPSTTQCVVTFKYLACDVEQNFELIKQLVTKHV